MFWSLSGLTFSCKWTLMKSKVFTVMKINILVCWVMISHKTPLWSPAFIGTSSCILDPEDEEFIWNLNNNSILNNKETSFQMYWLVHGIPNIENYVNLYKVFFPMPIIHSWKPVLYGVYIQDIIVIYWYLAVCDWNKRRGNCSTLALF